MFNSEMMKSPDLHTHTRTQPLVVKDKMGPCILNCQAQALVLKFRAEKIPLIPKSKSEGQIGLADTYSIISWAFQTAWYTVLSLNLDYSKDGYDCWEVHSSYVCRY